MDPLAMSGQLTAEELMEFISQARLRQAQRDAALAGVRNRTTPILAQLNPADLQAQQEQEALRRQELDSAVDSKVESLRHKSDIGSSVGAGARAQLKQLPANLVQSQILSGMMPLMGKQLSLGNRAKMQGAPTHLTGETKLNPTTNVAEPVLAANNPQQQAAQNVQASDRKARLFKAMYKKDLPSYIPTFKSKMYFKKPPELTKFQQNNGYSNTWLPHELLKNTAWNASFAGLDTTFRTAANQAWHRDGKDYDRLRQFYQAHPEYLGQGDDWAYSFLNNDPHKSVASRTLSGVARTLPGSIAASTLGAGVAGQVASPLTKRLDPSTKGLNPFQMGYREASGMFHVPQMQPGAPIRNTLMHPVFNQLVLPSVFSGLSSYHEAKSFDDPIYQ